MKLTFFKKNKTSSKKVFKQKISGEEQARHDWGVMVVAFAVLVVISMSFGTFLLMKINAGNFFASDEEVQDNKTVATKKVLLDAQNFFDTRQKEYDAFRSALPAEIDPSL